MSLFAAALGHRLSADAREALADAGELEGLAQKRASAVPWARGELACAGGRAPVWLPREGALTDLPALRDDAEHVAGG